MSFDNLVHSLSKAGKDVTQVLNRLFGQFETIETQQEALSQNQEQILTELQERAQENEGIGVMLHDTQEDISKLRARFETELDRITRRQETFEHNLEQVRRLQEEAVSKIERLSNEYIERHVQAPLFKDLLTIYSHLISLQQNRQPPSEMEMEAVAVLIRNVLESRDLALIEPKEDDSFDAKRFQPIKSQPTSVKQRHGLVAKLYHPGLATNGRVIQAARVAIYKYENPIPNHFKQEEL